MRYQATEWVSDKSRTTLPIHRNCHVEVTVVGQGFLAVGGVVLDDSDKAETTYLKAGEHGVFFKANLDGFDQLFIEGKSFSYNLRYNGTQYNEPMTADAPPPPKEPKNLLQRLKQAHLQDIHMRREAFANASPYTLSDDDPDAFEEDLYEHAKAALGATNSGPGNNGRGDAGNAGPGGTEGTPGGAAGAGEEGGDD